MSDSCLRLLSRLSFTSFLTNIFPSKVVLEGSSYILYLHTLVAGLLARIQYSEGPATGHLDTGFSCFPCVYKQLLRWFPTFQVATACFSCSRCADKSLGLTGRKQTRKHARDARDFNNIETRAVIKFFFSCKTNIKFNQNPSSESRFVPCRQTDRRTDRHNEARSRFSQFCDARLTNGRYTEGKESLGSTHLTDIATRVLGSPVQHSEWRGCINWGERDFCWRDLWLLRADCAEWRLVS